MNGQTRDAPQATESQGWRVRSLIWLFRRYEVAPWYGKLLAQPLFLPAAILLLCPTIQLIGPATVIVSLALVWIGAILPLSTYQLTALLIAPNVLVVGLGIVYWPVGALLQIMRELGFRDDEQPIDCKSE